MTGRKPKPNNLKLVQGNPGKRPINHEEPKPPPIAPKPPAWLHKEGKKEWKRLAPQLEKLGLLTQIDAAAFTCYCECWAQYRDAVEFTHKHGTVYPIKTNDGEVKYLQQVPQVGIANQMAKQMRSLCAEFGMTPSSRGRMNVPGEKTPDDFEEFLSRGSAGK